MSNIHGLGSVEDRNKGKKGDKGMEEFGVGGKSSGTSVMRPTDRGGGADANLNAALAAHARSLQGSAAGAADAPDAGQIILYRNGFKVGGEEAEFRDSSDARNKEFLATLLKGEMPAALEREIVAQHGADARQVRVQVVDRSKQDYVPPKPKFSFANSKGNSLRGGDDEKQAAAGTFENAHALTYSLPPNCAADNKAVVQIVTHDRKREKVTFAKNATVMEVYMHVMAMTGKDKFKLVAGFPPKPLTEPAATIAGTGLAGSSIQQRL